MKRSSGVEIVLLNNNFDIVISAVCVLNSPGYLIRFPPTVRRVRYGSYFGGKNPQQYDHMSHLYFYFQVYFFVAGKTLCLCLQTWCRILCLACLPNWQSIWSKMVRVLDFWWAVCTPWKLLCHHQWLYWPLLLDSFSVSPVESFLIKFPGYTCLSSEVFPSLYCEHPKAMLGVLYFNIPSPIYWLYFHT